MPKQVATGDRNFDDLSERFSRNIYGGLKGQIRLAVLRRDFAEQIPMPPFVPGTEAPPLRILDAGGGQGQFSIPLARAGHSVLLCDISEQMLKAARLEAEQQGVSERVTLQQTSIQQLAQERATDQPGFDLVICHAVLEWVESPQTVLQALVDLLAPGGYLSLSYYNLHGAVYKNLLRTNYKKVRNNDYGGFRGSLSPINPLYPETVDAWLAELPLQRLSSSGIRVFHDYILDKDAREQDGEALLEMELRFSQLEPYRSLGRYLHIIARREATP